MSKFTVKGRRGLTAALAFVTFGGLGGAALSAQPAFGASARSSNGTTGCATRVLPSSVGRLHGILRPFHAGAAATTATSCATRMAGGKLISHEAPYGGTPPLVYHGGPVLGTAAEGGQVTMTPIFWAPSGYSFPSGYQTIIDGFLTNLAADSGKPTNVFSTLTQYMDSGSHHIPYKIVAGTPIVDSQAFPTSGVCTPDSGAIYSDNSGYSECLSDANVQTEIQRLITADSLPTDYAHMYLAFLPKGVETCFYTLNGSQGGPCTINPYVATAGGFCAYHSGFTPTASTSTAIYANMPFPIYNSPQGYGCAGNTVETPNGNADADVEISPLSHEMAEAITDPLGTAWYDSSGNENGDDCAYIYGSGFGGTGTSQYNQTINGGHYFIQEEFSNEDFVASTSGCVQREELPTASYLVTTSSPVSGAPVAFDGTASSDGDPTGGSIASYQWNFGDGATATGASPTHTFATGGTYTVTLTVTDVDGWKSAVYSTSVIVAAGPTTSGLSPSTLLAGTSVTTGQLTGTGFASGATVAVSGTGVTATVSSLTATAISLTLTATSATAAGARDVTVTNTNGGSSKCAACLTILRPHVTSSSPAKVGQGAKSFLLTINGSNFNSGATVSDSESGVTFSSVVVHSSSKITAKVTVSLTATVAKTNLKVTDKGGAHATCTGCLQIDAGPKVTSATPSTLKIGKTTTVTLAGSHFVSGLKVSISGGGVTITISSVTSTAITIKVAVTSTATAGHRNVTVTNPDGGSITKTGLLDLIT